MCWFHLSIHERKKKVFIYNPKWFHGTLKKISSEQQTLNHKDKTAKV